MPLTRERKGELYIYSQAILWGLFPVITKLSYAGLTPLVSAAIGTAIAALFFAAVVTVRGEWKLRLPPGVWRDILLSTLFIGIAYYALLFIGLRYTTAGNASILWLTEVLFSFLILSVFMKHEPLRRPHVIGAACMVAGAAWILLPKTSGWHAGDPVVVLACMFPPLGNRFAQRARKTVSSAFIMLTRSAVSACFLAVLALCIEPLPSAEAVRATLPVLLINGIFLLGFSKILWFNGLNLLPITKSISLASIAPLFTLLFAYLLLGETATVTQVLGLVPILIGALLLTRASSLASSAGGSSRRS